MLKPLILFQIQPTNQETDRRKDKTMVLFLVLHSLKQKLTFLLAAVDRRLQNEKKKEKITQNEKLENASNFLYFRAKRFCLQNLREKIRRQSALGAAFTDPLEPKVSLRCLWLHHQS